MLKGDGPGLGTPDGAENFQVPKRTPLDSAAKTLSDTVIGTAVLGGELDPRVVESSARTFAHQMVGAMAGSIRQRAQELREPHLMPDWEMGIPAGWMSEHVRVRVETLEDVASSLENLLPKEKTPQAAEDSSPSSGYDHRADW